MKKQNKLRPALRGANHQKTVEKLPEISNLVIVVAKSQIFREAALSRFDTNCSDTIHLAKPERVGDKVRT